MRKNFVAMNAANSLETDITFMNNAFEECYKNFWIRFK